MMKLLLSIMGFLTAILSFAQTADEKVAAMMNGSEWFELREFFETNTESVNPFLNQYGKAMVAHYFNQPEIAVVYYSELLNNPQIDLGNVASAALLMCSDISKLGDNRAAAETLASINASIQPYYSYLDSSVVKAIKTDIAKYKALSTYKLNDLEPFGSEGTIPFNLVAVGSDSTRQEAMNVPGRINGHDCGMTFDTGAGVNVISDSLATAMSLDILDVDLAAGGFGVQSARLAVAKELKIGGLTIRNVPFYVMTIKSGNPEADKYLEHFQIIVGKNVMETLQYFTIDFANQSITVRAESGIPASVKPNLCISSGGIYRLLCTTFDGVRMMLNPDTGNASYGYLSSNMLPILKDNRPLELEEKPIRMAGAGGTSISQYYQVTDLPIEIGGVSTVIPRIALLGAEGQTDAEYDGLIGLSTFMLFDEVSFDIDRMIMYPSKQ